MARIVILEDYPTISRLYEVNLTARNYTVLSYYTGEEGLEGIRTQQPDLIVLNMMFPGKLKGWDVLNTMSTDESLRAIPTIVVTGVVEEYQRVYAAHPQVKHVLLKPFNLRALLSAIAQQVDASLDV